MQTTPVTPQKQVTIENLLEIQIHPKRAQMRTGERVRDLKALVSSSISMSDVYIDSTGVRRSDSGNIETASKSKTNIKVDRL